MLFFQAPNHDEVKNFVGQKLQETSGIDSDKYLSYILLVSAAFFLLSVGMTAYMVLRRHYKNKLKAKDDVLIEKIQNFLSSMLILPVDEAFLGIKKSNENEYRLSPDDITNAHNRIILAQEIYALKKDISGSQASQLTNYFYGLGLQSEVIKMLASKNVQQKMHAMKMIESFNIVECKDDAYQYIHSTNRDLAVLAIQNRIKFEMSLSVLYELETPLNDWECHKIIHTIESIKISFDEIYRLKQNIQEGHPILERLKTGLVKKQSPDLVLQ